MSLDKQLLQAVKDGKIEEGISLLGGGADVNAKDEHGTTLLHLIAISSNLEVAELLLQQKDINVNAKDNNGMIPLHWAAGSQNSEFVRLLLQHKKIDVNTKDHHGSTPLHWAVGSKNPEFVLLFLQHKDIDVNAKDNGGMTPLHYAARSGYTEIVKLLIKNKANVNAKDNNGITPLHWAAESGNTEIFFLLLLYGADISKESEYTRAKISSNDELNTCLTVFEATKKKPYLGKLIEANKNGDDANVMSKYINNETDQDTINQKELIEEFETVKKKSNLIFECLFDLVKHATHSYNVREFKVNAIDGLVQNTKDSNEQSVTGIPRKVIELIAQDITANDAQSSAITCKSANKTANKTANNAKKNSDALLTKLKEACKGEPNTSLTEVIEPESKHSKTNVVSNN